MYFLKKKSEVPDTIHAVVRYYKLMGIIIKKIRSDRGGEYGGHLELENIGGGAGHIQPGTDHDDTAFAEVCKTYEIIHEPIPAHTPELNGVAERWNRTVMSMANSMMYNARIHPMLWSSAVAHANYLRNRLPTKSRAGFTPHQLFTNRRPRYDNIKIWGCYCYKLIPIRNKIPGLPTRERLIYVGEASDSMGFRCFNPSTYKFTTEFELIFDEDEIGRGHDMLDATDPRRKLFKEDKIDLIPVIFSTDQALAKPSHKVYFSPPAKSNIWMSESAKMSVAPTQDCNLGRITKQSANLAEKAESTGLNGGCSTIDSKSLFNAMTKDVAKRSSDNCRNDMSLNDLDRNDPIGSNTILTNKYHSPAKGVEFDSGTTVTTHHLMPDQHAQVALPGSKANHLRRSTRIASDKPTKSIQQPPSIGCVEKPPIIGCIEDGSL